MKIHTKIFRLLIMTTACAQVHASDSPETEYNSGDVSYTVDANYHECTIRIPSSIVNGTIVEAAAKWIENKANEQNHRGRRSTKKDPKRATEDTQASIRRAREEFNDAKNSDEINRCLSEQVRKLYLLCINSSLTMITRDIVNEMTVREAGKTTEDTVTESSRTTEDTQ